MGKGTQALKGLAWLIAFVLGLGAGTARASHLDELRRAGQSIDVSDRELILGGSLTFLALAALIFFGLRYLRRMDRNEDV